MNIKKFAIFLCLFIIMQQGFPQLWEHYYGTTTYNEFCTFTANTYDHGYLVGGSTGIYEGIQFPTLYKLDFNGDTLWTKSINSQNHNQFQNIIQSSDGGYILAGFIYTSEIDSAVKPIVLKLNECAEYEWCTIFETDRLLPWAQSIMQTSDGGYILTLNSYGDYHTENTFLVKLNATGNVLWGRPVIDHIRYPDAFNPYSERMIRTRKGDYLVSGRVYWKNLFDDNIIIRPFYALFDDDGNEKWLSPFGLADTLFGTGWGCIELENGNFMCAARQYLGHGLQSGYIIEWDKEGALVQYKSVSPEEISPECYSHFFIDILQLDDKYSLCMPYLISSQESYPAVISIDTNVFNTGFSIEASRIFYDKTQWQFITKSNDNKILSVNHHRHSAYDRDFFIAKMNSMLVSDSLVQDNRTYDSLCPYPITHSKIYIDSCRMVTVVNSLSVPENKPAIKPEFKVYPNPCMDNCSINFDTENPVDNFVLMVCNLQGINYLNQSIKGRKVLTMDVSRWPRGMYILRVFRNGNVMGNQKLIIL